TVSSAARIPATRNAADIDIRQASMKSRPGRHRRPRLRDVEIDCPAYIARHPKARFRIEQEQQRARRRLCDRGAGEESPMTLRDDRWTSARQKFFEALYCLVCSNKPLRMRLTYAAQGLISLPPDQLPEHMRADFEQLMRDLTKRPLSSSHH